MFKKLLIACTALLLLSTRQVCYGADSLRVGCNITQAYMMSHAVPAAASSMPGMLPYMFPPSAIDTCGKIIFFYEDEALAWPSGFAEGAGIGSTRRATLCSVAGYIQSVFSFDNIPSGEYLRVLVSQSYTTLRPATLGIKSLLGAGWPYFDAAHTVGDSVNGYFHDFIMSGTDPAGGLRADSVFHGELFFNFDTIYLGHSLYSSGTEITWGDVIKVEMNNGLGELHNCEYDLYSIALHSMGHIMGWLSWGAVHTKATFFTSKLEKSLWHGQEPYGLYQPLSPLLPYTKPTPPGFTRLWATNQKAPENYPMEIYGSHISREVGQYTWFNRISPGDMQHYVMEYPMLQGVGKRKYLKGDLRVFTDNIGYKYSPTFLVDSAVMLANSIPWSSRMSYAMNVDMNVETIAPDYTMTNDIGSSLYIDLAADTSLHDDNGDTIRIFPGSLVNFRGCGIGGNNHNLLSVSPDGTNLIYTPRAGFYGRAQFGYNAWDGKEKGAFILVTIDVEKGSNVSVPPGGNLIQNGDAEEGEEVKIKDIAEDVNNTRGFYSEYTPGRWSGHHIDGQYYPAPAVIHNSFSECGYTTPYTFGSLYTSFPWPTADSTVWLTDLAKMRGKNPAPKSGIGERYINKHVPSFHLLNDTIRNCRRYRFEFDMARIEDTAGGDKDTVFLGLTAKSLVADPAVAHLLQTYKPQPIEGLRYDHWEHYTLPFTFCNDTPATILYLRTALAHMMDNLTLVELPDTVRLEVNAFAADLENCSKKLYTDVPDMGCPLSYVWTNLPGTVLGTGSELIVSALSQETYILTVNDGCGHTGSDTIEVAPCRCAPGEVFDGASYTTLSGTLPATLAPGLYYAATDLNVSSSSTFNNAVVLMEPDVAVFVNNTAKLTLDSTHLFTCPDTNRLWAGIRLQSAGSSSGRIEVRNGSLIEDAYYAVLAPNIKAPPSGNIIDISNSTFNRNWIGLSVNGAYTLGSAGTYPIKVQNTLFTARHFDTMAGYPLRWSPNVRLREELYTVTHTKAPYKINRDYAKAYLKNDTMAYMGIEFHNTGNTLVPGSSYAEVLVGEPNFAANRNIIDNMNYGFHSNNSNAVLVNTHIINIGKRMYPDDDTSHSYPSSAGWGIIGRSTGTRTNRVKVGAGANAGVKLYDCFTGIYMDDVADVDIKAVAIGSSHTEGAAVPGAARSSETYAGYGIQLIGNRNHLKWGITQDTISNIHTGIYLWLGNPVAGATTEIRNNMLYDQNRSARFSGLTAGQYVMNALVADGPGYSPVSTLGIVTNTLDGVYNGILLNSLRSAKPLVDNNTIVLRDKTMTTIGTPQYGISAQNCQEGTISGNTVSVPTLGSEVNAINIKGFYASKNSNLRLCGNFANRTGSAFVFEGRDAQVGTRWVGNTINDGWQGMTLASDIGDQGFMYNWATMSPFTFYGATGNKWTGYGGTKINTVAVDPTNTMLSKLYVNNITTGTAERPTVNASDPPGLSFPKLYRYTGATESIRVPTAQWAANCHGAIYPQQVDPRPDISAPFRIVGGLGRLVVQDSLGYDSSYHASQWCSQLAVYELATLHPELRDSSGLLDTFMTYAAGSRFAWLTAIGQALGTGDIATAQSLLNSPVQAMGRVAANGTVVVTDYAEANGIVSDYLACYHAHIRMLQHSITPADTALLGAIARKCPAVAGAVVYRARGLYRVLTGLSVQYQDDSCAYGGQSLYRIAPGDGAFPSFEEPGVGYSLYPNPNKGVFSIRQTTPADKAVEARVYNAWGQEVHRETVHFKNGMATFKLQNAVPGLYLICLTEGQKTSCLKFNIH